MLAGVEAHTIVRDQLTSQDEQAAIKEGRLEQGSLRSNATSVDAMVSTIGFPLVGGPAGRLSRMMAVKQPLACSFSVI
jgi:magnesium chelatase subunit H